MIPDPTAAAVDTRFQVAEMKVFAGGEGAWFDGEALYFTTKVDNRVWRHDPEANALTMIYDWATSPDPLLTGVDNVTVAGSGDVFVCEDGGNMEIVMLTPEGTVAPFLRLGVSGSELTGVAFDPSGTRMYFSSQRNPGTTYEVSGPFRSAASCGDPGFVDVPAGAFYEQAVAWAACEGITTGTSPTTFSPDATAVRSHAATFLWRFAAEPTGLAHSFGDVPAGSFFEDAVAWMATTGITTGTTPTTFDPNATVTRAQMATFLWRYVGRPTGFTHSFNDVPAGAFFAEAVAWMATTGITTGTTPTTFSPNDPLTRAQAVTFLWRFAGRP